MRIVFIGAGRLASNLAPALQASGAEVVEVWSRTRVSAETLAAQLGCRAVWGCVDDVCTTADLYLLSVTDAVLPQVVARLHSHREQALFAHTAGSMPLSLFPEAGHARGAVFYPMQTFSKGRSVDFRQVHFFVETAFEDDYRSLDALAQQLSPHVHRSTSASRRRLHLAAVFACNFVNHCCTLADDLLHDGDLDFSVMQPLLEETVAKLRQMPPAEAQTGPAVRRDDNVMGMQRAMLADRPDVQRLYTLLSESIQQYNI